MSVRLLDNRVLIRPNKEHTSEGGIVIPNAAQQKSDTGVVVAVGEGKLLESGERSKITVKKDDNVLYSKYSGTEVKLSGEEYLIVREEDIMGVVN